MTTNVTSIVSARQATRRHAATGQANRRLAFILLTVSGLLIVVGLGATLSASSVMGLDRAQDRFLFFRRQLLGVGIGAVAMVAAARLPYRLYRRLAGLMYLVVIVLLVAVLVAGERVNGATRWLTVAGINLQPAELAKPVVIIALATIFDKKDRLLIDIRHFFAPVVGVVGLVVALVMLQPDLGTTIVIGAGAMGVLLASAAPFRYILGAGAAALGATGLLAVAAPYRFDRLKAFLDPWNDSLDAGYQLIQSYAALGTGGVSGVGLGASRARWFFLPNAHTDFIFAIVGEETGLVGGLTIVVLFMLLAAAGVAVVRRSPDRYAAMLAMGVVTWLSLQAIVNIGGVVGALPITGIPLPLMSFGSTALIAAMGGIGLLINVALAGRPVEKGRR